MTSSFLSIDSQVQLGRTTKTSRSSKSVRIRVSSSRTSGHTLLIEGKLLHAVRADGLSSRAHQDVSKCEIKGILGGVGVDEVIVDGGGELDLQRRTHFVQTLKNVFGEMDQISDIFISSP